MYQLTVKETRGLQTWKLNIGEKAPRCPSSFQSERNELKLAAIFFPDNSLKELFKTILLESTHTYFSFQVEKIDAENHKEEETQTITIFKGMDVVPESGRELVLHMVTGQFLAPAVYKKGCGHFHTPGGEARPYMIKEWAYQDELNNVLGLKAVDPEKLKELNKRADNDKGANGINPEKLFEMILEGITQIFPEAKVTVHKS